MTAQNIEYAFQTGTAQTSYTAPVVFPPDSSVSRRHRSPTRGPTIRRPRFGRRCRGDGHRPQRHGVRRHLYGRFGHRAAAAVDGSGLDGQSAGRCDGANHQESSDEFRVNAPEPRRSELRSAPTSTTRPMPQVAMDADGDFVITWQSVVPDAVNPRQRHRHFCPAVLAGRLRHRGDAGHPVHSHRDGCAVGHVSR